MMPNFETSRRAVAGTGRRATPLFAAAVLCAGTLFAQSDSRWEASLFGGGSFGSRISLTPSAASDIGDAGAYGLRLSFGVTRHFALETTFSHARPSLTSKDPVSGVSLGPSSSVDVSNYELNGLFGWGRGRARGYFGLGFGAMHLGLPQELDPGTRLTANFAIGGKFFFTDDLALRLDARYRWRVTDSRVGTVLCGSEGCQTFTTNLYSSAEVTAGMSYRFGPRLDPDGSDTASASSSGEKRFLPAAGEVVLLELIPWSFNRYVSNAEFAHISLDTIKANFETGFTYDRDHFNTNQSSHPYHGSLYFNAARTNGYGYWESGAFTLVGSFLWEGFMEREPPSINDLVNTTLGGMTRGEIQYRLSNIVLDNTASGSERLWREVGGALLNPVGAFNRLINGDMSRDFPNPDDRDPNFLHVVGDLGYRHIDGVTEHANQGIFSLSLIYGDPFQTRFEKPFDVFTATIDLNYPGGTLVSRIDERGILKGWELDDRTDPAEPARQIFILSQDYLYYNNASQVVGAQAFGAGLVSRYGQVSSFGVVTDISALAVPLGAVQTTDFLNPTTGRNFDYGPGGGIRAGARFFVRGREVGGLGYGVAWMATAQGTSDNNTLQFFRATARVPIVGRLGVGGGYAWYSRKTSYSGFFEPRKTQSEWRLFGTWAFL
jgi:Domain of unknown function (DUF3943)/Outer membrane protein beta-barrel domain